MQLKIHTDQNVIVLEHTQHAAKQEQVNYAMIETNTRIGSCRFRIVDTTIGQVWIGDYDIEDNYTLQVGRASTGLLIVIQYTLGSLTPGLATEQALPFRSLSWFAQNSNYLKLSFPKGRGYLLLFSYENGFCNSTLSFLQQTHAVIDQHPRGSDNDILNLVQAVLKYPLVNDHLQVYLRIKSEELGILLINEVEKTKSTTVLPADVIHKMQEIDKLVRENLQTNYSIVQLSRHTRLNISNLKKYCKIYFSKSIHQYLLHIKMEEAEKRITTRDESLRDIAFDLGFKNEPNFSVAFKKCYGYPPGHLRKKAEQLRKKYF